MFLQALLRWYHAEVIAWLQLPGVQAESWRISRLEQHPDRSKALAMRQVQTLYKHCITNVPYYKALANVWAVSTSQTQRPKQRDSERIARLPITKKKDLRLWLIFFLRKGKGSFQATASMTSGTTGDVLVVPTSWRSQIRDGALLKWHQRRYQLPKRTRQWNRPTHSVFVGDLGKLAQTRASWLDGGKRITLSLSSEDPGRDLKRYAEYGLLKEVHSIAGRPSTLECLLTCGPLELKRALPRLCTIYSGGEELEPNAKQQLETHLNVRVHNVYALTELGIIGITCPENNGFHYIPWHWEIEALTSASESYPAGYDVPKRGGELLISSLDERLFPLIRYATGDIGWTTNECCQCGCKLPRLHLLSGRKAQKRRDNNQKSYDPYTVAMLLKPLHIKSYCIVVDASNHFHIFYTGNVTPDQVLQHMISEATTILGLNLTFKIFTGRPQLRPGAKRQAFVHERDLLNPAILANPKASNPPQNTSMNNAKIGPKTQQTDQ